MRSEARVDSVLFHLTPTRTRCDLVITACGKAEKIASGLLEPFLAHLKTAQDQIAKGGYSITLEPDHEIDARWLTKGTVERFVCFVNTPELLERVTTIESEILQIENAISIQGNSNIGLRSVDGHQTMLTEGREGCKATVDVDAEKSMNIYELGQQLHPPDSNGSTIQQQNSKVQLLRVLETRKMVLQKEQGMAFAHAVAAGFELDNMEHLVSFAESFGASRLMQACLEFIDLWKKKHETGQWLEVESAEAISTQSNLFSSNASGIILSTDTVKQKESGEAWPIFGADAGAESKGKDDKHIPSNPKAPLGSQEYFQGQFQQPTSYQWPMYPPPGTPVCQPYPIPGMPYYQNFLGGIPHFHPPDDIRFNNSQRNGLRRHSMDDRKNKIESETSQRWPRSQDGRDEDMSDIDNDDSHGRETRKKIGRSGKENSNVVVIRNLNYITPKRHGTSGSGSRSNSDMETEEEIEENHKHSVKASKKEVNHAKFIKNADTKRKNEVAYGQQADSGNWQNFENFLLKSEEITRNIDEEITRNVNEDMFSGEKVPPVKIKENKNEGDPLFLPERDSDDIYEQKMLGYDPFNVTASLMKREPSHDDLLFSNDGKDLTDNQLKEIGDGEGRCQKMISDEFMLYQQKNQFVSDNSSGPVVDHAYENFGNIDKSSSYNLTDDSFMLPYRSVSQDHLETGSRTVIDMVSEFPSALQSTRDSSYGGTSPLNYEPDDLSLVPERGMESLYISYDPAVYYDLQISVEDDVVKLEAGNKEDVSTSIKQEPKKSDKERNSRVSQDSLEKRRKDALMKKGTSSRMTPLSEAQKRAEKLPVFKVDLQNARKEKEKQEKKRLEALKRERERRIAARSSSTGTRSPLKPQQDKAQLVTKLPPRPSKGSNFNDLAPGSSSSLHKLQIETTSDGPNKVASSKRSVSSLPELKKEGIRVLPEAKSASPQTRRDSDPKGSYKQHTSLVSSGSSSSQVKKSTPDTSKKTGIIRLDKSVAATLPDPNIRTSEATQKISDTEELSQKGTGIEASHDS